MGKTFRNLALIMLSIFVVSSSTAFSQKNVGKLARHDAKDFSYGLKIGLNVSTITYGGDEVKSRVGLVGGIFGKIKLGTDLGLSAELLYSQQGCDLEGNYDNFTTLTASIKADYLNIPILLNWYVPGVDGLSIKAGLQPGFLLSSSVDATLGNLTVNIDDEFSFNSVDFSIPLGISYELAFGLLFDVRYNIGITDVFEDGKGSNNVFQFTVGYRF